MGMTQGIHRALSVNPRGLATSFKGRTRSWAEFADRIARIAAGFRDLGARPGDRIAVLMANSDRYFECYAAIPWAGCLIVPLNTRWSDAELAAALDDCQAKILILDEAMTDLAVRAFRKARRRPKLVFAGDQDGSPDIGVRILASYEDLASGPAPMAEVGRSDQDVVGIFYTGGTTGRAKGVMLTHGNVVSAAMMILAEGLLGEEARYLHVAPMFHMADGAACYALLTSGGASVILETFDPARVVQTIEKESITETLMVPTMIQLLLAEPSLKSADISSLQRVLYGASPINEAVLDEALRLMPGVAFIQLYGMTELSPVATVLHARHLIDEGRAKGRRRSAGRAGLGVELRIVAADGSTLPAGEVGEVVVRSRGVMAGYWRRPAETKAAVRDGWMHTGDAGYLDDDGFLYIVDRIKDMIVSGGENVYSAEVENAIARLPQIAQTAVIGIPSEKWGEQVHAIVVLKPEATASEADIVEFCKQSIAGYKCPRSVEFVQAMPLTGAGKVDKQELRRRHWAGQNRAVH